MSKLKPFTLDGKLLGWRFFCPGCECSHILSIDHDPRDRRFPNDPVWKFDGNMDAPTFEPSLLYPGWIEFLSDCSHSLAAQIVPMTDMDNPMEL